VVGKRYPSTEEPRAPTAARSSEFSRRHDDRIGRDSQVLFQLHGYLGQRHPFGDDNLGDGWSTPAQHPQYLAHWRSRAKRVDTGLDVPVSMTFKRATLELGRRGDDLVNDEGFGDRVEWGVDRDFDPDRLRTGGPLASRQRQ